MDFKIDFIDISISFKRLITVDLMNRVHYDVFQLSSLCNVEVRSFPFHQYPPHIAKLKTYSWKPIIIHVSITAY